MRLRRLIFIAVLTFGLIAIACGSRRVTPTVTIPASAASLTPTEAPKVPGQVAAVDLLGAWVAAGVPGPTELFEFIGLDGQTYMATFADDIFPLFDRPNRWFDGAKECSNCHVSDLAGADAELDLSSYEGILAGSYRLSNPPGTPIIVPGDWQASPLRDRLMWNRMPIGIDSEAERDGPEVEAGGGKVLAVNLIGAWVAAGASTTEPFQFTGLDGNVYFTTYGESIEPLFTQSDVWYLGTKSCQRCHVAKVSESDAELDMSSIEGILAGSYRLSQPPGLPIIVPGDWQGSLLRSRLRNNRMPSGITDDVPPEGPIVEAGYLK